MNGGSTKDNERRRFAFAAPENFTAPNAERSELPIRGRPGMNPSHHGSDEQMSGAKQQVLRRGQGD
jgi:hypothetical protein